MTAPNRCDFCPAGSWPCRHTEPSRWRKVTLYLNAGSEGYSDNSIEDAVEDAIDNNTPFLAWEIEVYPC